MPNRPPPSRLKVQEIKRRLVVIDTETGAPPLTAAERMTLLDAQAGHVPPLNRAASPEKIAANTPPSPTAASSVQDGRNRPAPWKTSAAAAAPSSQAARRTSGAKAAPSPAPNAPAASSNAAPIASSFTSSAALDRKGPRLVQLTSKGRSIFNAMLKTLAGALVSLLVIAFLLDTILGFACLFIIPMALAKHRRAIGAYVIDTALTGQQKSRS